MSRQKKSPFPGPCPYPQIALIAAGGDQRARAVECYGKERIPCHFECRNFFFGGDVPQVDLGVAITRDCQTFASLVHGKGPYTDISEIGHLLALACRQIDTAHELGGGEQALAVGGKSQSMYPYRMPLGLAQEFAVFEVPPFRLVGTPASRGQSLAVWTDCQHMDSIAMVKGVPALFAIGHVPEFDFGIAPCRDQYFRVRAER